MHADRLAQAAGLFIVASASLAAGQDEPSQVESSITDAGPVEVVRLARDLEHPWGMALLPDGRVLLTERAGRLRIVDKDGKLDGTVGGTPDVVYKETDQGGLLDVAVTETFADEPWVYLTYSKPGPDGKAATAVGRGKLNGDELEDFADIFVQEPWIEGGKHFGSRIVPTRDGHLFVALGDRYQFNPAQDVGTHLGKVIRIPVDGSTPAENPFMGREGAKPEIWSYGHRNIQAAAMDPATGLLWVAEMGPLGGDELNLVMPGGNYGWPEVSWGMNYDTSEIPKPPSRPEFTDAAIYWSPVISPSGMIFYTGDKFPAWRGSALVGGLSGHTLVRLRIRGDRVVDEERVPMPGRVRDLQQMPDGTIYVVSDPKESRGELWRLQPLTAESGASK